MIRLPERYQKKIIIDYNGCWIWQGEISTKGYGRGWYLNHRYQAHRLIYWLIGDKPFKIDNLKTELDHLCENKSCVNPNHMDIVNRKVNCKRIYSRRKKCL